MSTAEWQGIYDRAWHLYYTPEHIATLLKRAVACGIPTGRMIAMIFNFYATYAFEHVHPLQGGIIRRKYRTQRRPDFRRENVFAFFVRRTREIFSAYVPGLWFLWRLERLRRKIEKDPKSKNYTDLALRPVDEGEFSDGLELYRATDSAIVAANQAKSLTRERSRIESAHVAPR
jgi:hypothetical protein